MAEIHNLPERTAQRSSTSLDLSRQTWNEKLRPAPVTEAVAMLSTCLALVKPVGMSGEDAQAWLRVAAGEVRHLSPELLADGCAAARKTCTHHGQIVPAILKATDDRLANLRKLAGPREIPAERRLAAPEPWAPTAEELEALKQEAARRLAAD